MDHYTGTFSLKQTDFGIHPVSAAGGTVKVKDELSVAFDLVANKRSTSRAKHSVPGHAP